ncbi:MAG: sigma-70 family RNA polymerase sigma factor [Pseudomonadota bacterium]|nr:sigma-70 family RNA polymerase sigma factor [Pseudomonadota bacterium]
MVDETEISAPAPDQHYQAIELAQLRRKVVEIVDRLSAQQRTVIRYHYLQDHSFEDIAVLMTVTRSRISQIHRQALEALRLQLQATSTCDVAW